jgi:RNA-directed DNA polymerase
MKWPRKKSMDRLKDMIRMKTGRGQGRSMEQICRDINRTLGGWFEYYKHSNAKTHETVDRYIRGRLRSILRRRERRTGKARGRDHQKWPNAYFTAMGLICLKQAHRAACQSL